MHTFRRIINLCLFLVSLCLFSQYKVTGKIVNQEGKAIYGAKIILEGTILSTESDQQGAFTFDKIKKGNYLLLVSAQSYEVYSQSVEVRENIKLSPFVLKKDLENIISLEGAELDQEDGGAISSSISYLQASRDIYQKVSAYQWGGFFFKPRGYDSSKEMVLFNGIEMNKAQNGRPLWRDWGGLNDVTRYPEELQYGLTPSSRTFGLAAAITNFSTRASDYSKGGRLSFSLTNYSYTQRLMATYATGMQENGWAYVVSGSRRWADEGVIDGTLYDAWSYFLSIERKISSKQSLNFTAFGAPYRRAGNSPNTQEVFDLAGIHYNAYWGYQGGKKRNERIRKTFEPVFMLSHDFNISNQTKLETTFSFQAGRNSYSRLSRGDFQLTKTGYLEFLSDPRNFNPKYHYDYVASPTPIYYHYLPSHFNSDNRREYDLINWDNPYPQAGPVLNRQINWDYLYQTNYYNSVAGLGAAYFLDEDVNEDKIFNAYTHLKTRLTKHALFNGTLSYRYTQSENFKELKDLLGGLPIKNIDFFTNTRYNTIENENRRVNQGQKYNYDYNLYHHRANAYGLLNFSYNRWDYHLGLNYSFTQFWRKGKYKNDFDPQNSLGNSKLLYFNDFGVNAGSTFKINGKNFLELQGLYQTRAPYPENVFTNIRYLNFIPKGIKSTKILSGELNYSYRTKKLDAKISSYFTQLHNQTDVQNYYLNNKEEESGFLYQSLYGIGTRHFGVEFGTSYSISSTLKAIGALSLGQYTYTNNPKAVIYSDGKILDQNSFKTVYFKNYKVSGTPQRAYNIGLEYRSPRYWWISANWNLLSNNYVSITPAKHTQAFIANVPATKQAREEVDKLLAQERFSAEYVVNLSIGKSWRIKGKGILFSLNINNVLNNKNIKTGGFEQGYLGSYAAAQKESQSENPRYGNRYWYQQGVSFFANLVYKF